jgi:acyl-CoA thioesterase I
VAGTLPGMVAGTFSAQVAGTFSAQVAGTFLRKVAGTFLGVLRLYNDAMLFTQTRLRVALALLTAGLTVGAGLACRGSSGDATEAPRGGDAADASAAADPTAPRVRPKVVVLGDSLTAGYGLLESQSFPAVLQAKIDAEGYDFDVVNAGVSGDTSAGGLRRLDWALEGDVRVLVVALGGNDGLRGLSIADMQRNLTRIIQEAKSKGVLVILAGMEAPPNFGQEYTLAFRQAFREVALKERVLFIPFLLQDVAGISHLNLPDGIHPNAQGATRVADTVWGVLGPTLDQMAGAS